MFFLLLLFDLIFYVILNHVINKEENKNRNLVEDVAKASLLAIGITISGTALATINSIENKNDLRVCVFLCAMIVISMCCMYFGAYGFKSLNLFEAEEIKERDANQDLVIAK